MIRNFWVGDFQLKLMLCCYFLETDGSYLSLLSRSKLNNMKNLTQLLMKYSFDHCTEFFLLRFLIGRWHSETVQLSNKLKLLCVMFSFKIRPKTYTSSNWITEKATWQVMPSVHPRPNPFHPTPLNSLLYLISYW